jgi:superfamily II DNA helicase RecQ
MVLIHLLLPTRGASKADGLAPGELRPGEQAVIDAVIAKSHTLDIMLTGAGKSLCYQVPAMLMPGMTVLVSPLIALMRDQFDKLSALGETVCGPCDNCRGLSIRSENVAAGAA